MKCLREELIQKYIDKETSGKEEALINKHLAECQECRDKIEDYQRSLDAIKKAISLLDENEIEVPGFEKPLLPKKNIRSIFKAMLYPAAAACILVILLVFLQKEKTEVEMTYSYDLANEYDSNLPVTDQEMVIQIIDSEGNIIKY
jgi:predicted anti-sigma-YlaC factor YlaD